MGHSRVSPCLGRSKTARLSFTPRRIERLLALGWAALTASGVASAQTTATPKEPSHKEQFLVWELNRARSDPQAWAIENVIGVDLSGVEPRPPLALNESLTGSGFFHADEMGREQYFAHESPVTGEFANQWARDASYPLNSSLPNGINSIESIACGFGNPPQGSPFHLPLEVLKTLITDAGVVGFGHRRHLLGIGSFEVMREVGAGYASTGSLFMNYWAIHTGFRDVDPVWLTGVVYADGDQNELYDEGEGLGGVTVDVGDDSLQTNGAGGWSLAVSARTHLVSCTGGSFAGTASGSVVVSDMNREVDCISGSDTLMVDFRVPEPGALALQLAALATCGSLAGIRHVGRGGRRRSGRTWRDPLSGRIRR